MPVAVGRDVVHVDDAHRGAELHEVDDALVAHEVFVGDHPGEAQCGRGFPAAVRCDAVGGREHEGEVGEVAVVVAVVGVPAYVLRVERHAGGFIELVGIKQHRVDVVLAEAAAPVHVQLEVERAVLPVQVRVAVGLTHGTALHHAAEHGLAVLPSAYGLHAPRLRAAVVFPEGGKVVVAKTRLCAQALGDGGEILLQGHVGIEGAGMSFGVAVSLSQINGVVIAVPSVVATPKPVLGLDGEGGGGSRIDLADEVITRGTGSAELIQYTGDVGLHRGGGGQVDVQVRAEIQA